MLLRTALKRRREITTRARPVLFDHKPVEQLTDDDLRSLIGVRENEHIEFKLIYNLFGNDAQSTSAEKYELLKDIASMANAGGGYIFVGIRANDKSIAVKFESLGVHILERLKQSILALCVEHIEERISGLEVKDRIVGGHNLIVIRVPSSPQIPHMVKFLNNTHFTKRYQDGKREMSFAEIRFNFNNDMTARSLVSIEQLLLSRGARPATKAEGTDYFADSRLSEKRDGREPMNIVLDEFIKAHDHPAYYIAIGPRHPKSQQLDLKSKELREFLQTISQHERPRGWNMGRVQRDG